MTAGPGAGPAPQPVVPANARAAAATGLREAFGVPGAVLCASYVGFGALAQDTGWSFALVLVSTLTIWALPAQLILMEMTLVAAPLAAIIAAVVLASARFLPMTLSLMAVLRDARHAPWRTYAAAHFVAMTCWAVTMRRAPDLPGPLRLPYFVGFSAACLASACAGATAGYFGAWLIPPVLAVAAPFLTPVYFLLILLGEVRGAAERLALALGVAAGPAFLALTPQWSVLASGLACGTVAFLLQRAWARRR